MRIEPLNGIVATINYTTFSNTEACRNQCKTIFDQAIAASGCSPIRQVDVYDESILVFAENHQALTFLVNALRCATELKSSSDCELSLKAGLCKGDYFIHEDNIYGDAVNLATKLACTSRNNELLVCGIDLQIVKDFVKIQKDVTYFVRNQKENCTSIGLVGQDNTSSESIAKVLEIVFNNESCAFEKSRQQKIKIGRGEDADIHIDGNHISRNHATILLHYDRIYVEDHSANGTYIYSANREIFLTNDSMQIDHDGHISCGLPRSNKTGANPDLISFRLNEQARPAA